MQDVEKRNADIQATSLKHVFNPTYFEWLCPVLKDCIPNFDCLDFTFRIFNNRWHDLELKERVRHMSTVLHHFLPEDFTVAVYYIVDIARTLEARDRPRRFENIFLADYIEVYGLAHPEQSLVALGEVAKLVNAGFGQAAFLLRDPGKNKQFFRR